MIRGYVFVFLAMFLLTTPALSSTSLDAITNVREALTINFTKTTLKEADYERQRGRLGQADTAMPDELNTAGANNVLVAVSRRVNHGNDGAKTLGNKSKMQREEKEQKDSKGKGRQPKGEVNDEFHSESAPQTSACNCDFRCRSNGSRGGCAVDCQFSNGTICWPPY
ncbi:hypothetical protein ACA910_007335 [Epithemia clementina (nom. ined.)]